MLDVFAWMIAFFIFVVVLVPMIYIFLMTFAGILKGGEIEYDDEENGYVIMPDGTVRFDYEEYVR